MDIKKVEENWLARGFSCGLWTDPPGQVWTDYVHDVDELFMVVSGNVVLEMNGNKFHLKIGEEQLIPANVLHTVRNVAAAQSQWLYGYKKSKE